MGENLKQRYNSLAELIYDREPNDNFQRIAEKSGVTQDQLKTMTETLRNIEKNKNIVPTMEQFTRVRVGKLTVPKSFQRHVELLAKFAEVSEESVWQLLMIECCTMYANKYISVVEVLNESIVSQREGEA
jgi:hypothetical protein